MAFKELSLFEKIKYVFQNMTLEPVCFIFAMNWGFYAIASDQLYVDKMCQVNLNHSKELCDDIYSHPELQKELQERVTSLKTTSRVIQAIPPFVYALIAGPWCDKYGRKPLIVVSIFSYAVANAIFLINTIWWDELKAEYLLFECLQDLTGGSILFWLGAYTMVADIRKRNGEESATFRIAMMDGLIHIGFYTGNAMAGPVKTNLGLKYNFALGALMTIIAAAYTIIFIKETLVKPEAVVREVEDDDTISKEDYDIYEGIWVRSSDGAKIRCHFRFDGRLNCKWDEGGAQNVLEVTKTCLTWDKDSTVNGSFDNGSIAWSNGSIWIKEVSPKERGHNANEQSFCRRILPSSVVNKIALVFKAILEMKEGVRTVLKKRSHNERLCVILMMSAFLLEIFTNYSWGNLFMYYRLKLKFRMSDFSTLMSLAGFVGLTGQYVFVPLFVYKLKFHDATICLLDAFTSTIKTMIVAFLIPPTWMLYFACGVGFLDSTSTTVMRSMIISVVPVSEIGKVFSVVEFVKAIISLTAPVIYGKLYEYTIRTDPATFLYLSSAVKVSVFVVALLIYIQLGKRENLKKQEKQDKYSHKKDDKPIRYEDTEESKQNSSTDSFVRKETELPLPTYGETDMSMNISQDNELNQNENEAMQQDTHSLNSWNTKL